MEIPNLSVISTEVNQRVHIKLSRQSALNSLSVDMLSLISQYARKANQENKHMIFTGQGRAFCAGGDVVSIVKGTTSPEALFGSEFGLFYYLSEMKTERIAIMDGIVMGGGVGLSMCCSLRVATPKTNWAMPETAIGFIPDVGASYFLSHMTQPEVGLFLALTGERLNGVDCYLFGLADYYIDENIESLINELYNQNHREVLTRFHRHPDESLSKIMPIIQDLKHCFDIYSDLGLMLNRLCLLNTQWSQQTYLKLSEMCPLSLKLAYESFSRGKYLNYKDCLIMEYNLVIQLSKHRSYNFREAITHKLINKAKGRPNWQPDSLEAIDDAIIRSYFVNDEGPHLRL